MTSARILSMMVCLAGVACGIDNGNDLLGGSPRENHPLSEPRPAEEKTTAPATAPETVVGITDNAAPVGTPAATPTPAVTPIADAFAGVAAYVAKTGGSTLKGDHPNGGNPAGEDCTSASCHGPGGEGPRFFAAGTIRNGATPLAQVEVRLADATGAGVSSFTDANGNFYIKASDVTAKLTLPLRTAVRDATTLRVMSATITSGSCNGVSCHGGPQGAVHLP